jgi:peptide/bleomycin uptake transporter
MLGSFFPRPVLFFLSAIIWTALLVVFWYGYGTQLGQIFGFDIIEDREAVIGLGFFVTPEFQWFYIFYFIANALFAGFWFIWSPHSWQLWSIVGSQLILFSTYFSVQVSVALNYWRRPFFDNIIAALDPEKNVPASELMALLVIFAQIALLWMVIYVATRFFVSHYIFRWRTAMNNYYFSQWSRVRHIEGASQRIQEDTMRFAGIMESLGVSIVDSIMTLFAFLPLLLSLSSYVSELPIIGVIPYPLMFAAIFWSLFGTILLAVVGIKLPGLEFRNQRVEAAFRKELVYGEDDETRATPPTIKELFSNVRRNYFRLYFHYMYFNVFRGLYIQADNIFAYFILIPSIAVGAFTYGVMQQILTAFTQVSSSFQYLVNSWTTIIELLSIFKRLQAFERAMLGQSLPNIDEDFIQTGGLEK